MNTVAFTGFLGGALVGVDLLPWLLCAFVFVCLPVTVRMGRVANAVYP